MAGKKGKRRKSKGGKLRAWRKRLRAWAERHGIWFALMRLMMAGFVVVGLVLVYFAAQLPDIRAIDTIRKQQGITIESADGRVIANYGDVYGAYIPYDQLPKSLVLAVIATEDRRFFEHHGVDVFGIARAVVTNIRRGHMVQGGSTVTQQVAKNVFLTPERTLSRKLQEVMLAFWLEARFSKKEIMAIYLNRVYLGAGTFGVDAASRRYFNKSAKDLTIYESALLAGLLKAPSRYSPAADTDRARARVKQVLINMVDAGYLKEKDVPVVMNNYAKVAPHKAENGGSIRYFTDWIVDEQIPEVVGESNQDLIVTTTLDAAMQVQAQAALKNVMEKEGPKKNASQAALVTMTPDGAVQALVGGVDYSQSQYNRVTQARRQPGSSFKLFVYLAALEAGLTPQSMVLDAPISIQVGNKTWNPENYHGGYLGDVPMVVALRNSLNTVSVRLSQYTGLSKVAAMAGRLGIPNIPTRPSIALGAVEASLLEMTAAYAHLPNGGNRLAPYGILKIRTRDGREIYRHEQPPANTIIAKGTVEMMNFMLLDVVARGTGTKAALAKRQVAGKTGTSQDFKDAWFIGFTPQLVTGVWVGNDNNRPMKKVTGGMLPCMIWHDFMTQATAAMPVRSIPASAGSSEGLLPWLFGGDNGALEDGERESFNVDGSNAPVDTPPGSDADSGAEVHGDRRVPEDNPPEEVEEGAAPARRSGGEARGGRDVLTPEFWQKLEQKLPENPEKGKVEYSYPGQAR